MTSPTQPDLAAIAALAQLLAERNEVDARIANLIRRPATTGHIGEFIAAAIFDIRLWESASQKGHDGVFASGPLAGKTVNVKFYPAFERLLDVHPSSPPHFYLVLAGAGRPAGEARGARPLLVRHVFLFDAHVLMKQLEERQVAIGVATSIPRDAWRQTEVYPEQRNPAMPLSPQQVEALRLLSGED